MFALIAVDLELHEMRTAYEQHLSDAMDHRAIPALPGRSYSSIYGSQRCWLVPSRYLLDIHDLVSVPLEYVILSEPDGPAKLDTGYYLQQVPRADTNYLTLGASIYILQATGGSR
jgi:hypothetical protein